MGFINVHRTVRTHLFRERFEVYGAVIIPFLFMAESGYANAWVFGGGHLGWDLNSLMAVGRGFALELFIYVCFRIVRSFMQANRWFILVPPLLVGLIAMVVSAGMNLGWMAQSPEMQVAMGAVSQFMPDWMANTFRVGLGLLFPVGVGLFALYDVGHLIEEMFKSAHLDERAVRVYEGEIHRSGYLKSMKRAARKNQGNYDSICDANAGRLVESVKRGDLSFGANDYAKPAAQSSVTRVNPVGPLSLPVAPPKSTPAFPPMPPLSAFSKQGTGQGGA